MSRYIKLEGATLTMGFPEIMGNHATDTKLRKRVYFIHRVLGPAKALPLCDKLLICCRIPKAKLYATGEEERSRALLIA